MVRSSSRRTLFPRTPVIGGGTLGALSSPALATAQTSQVPQTQLFIGWTHAEASQLAHQFATTSENGVEIAVSRNVWRWFAIQGDVTGRYGAPINTQSDAG